MNIPKELKVGAITYKVSIVSDIVDTSPLTGRINYPGQVIELKKQEGEGYMFNSFLHEMVHAIHEHTGQNQSSCPPSEEDVERTANALAMIIKDNPGIFMP